MFKRVLAAAFVASTFVGSIAQAAAIDLAFIMDASGSIASSDFDSAMDSLASALETNIPVGGADTYRIGVVTFSNSAQLTTLKTITTAADLATVADDIRNQSFIGSTTNYQRAFNLVTSSFGALGDTSIVNMMTDGNPNRGNTGAGLNNLKGAGWDSLSFESIGGGADNTFLAGLAYDTGGAGGAILGDATQITDPLNAAFVLEVSGFGAAYDVAIATKVQKLVNPSPVPLPAALPLLAGGLFLIGFAGRRKYAA